MTRDLTTVGQGREASTAERREKLIELVTGNFVSEHSRRAYCTGLEQFFTWWERTEPGEAFSASLVQHYRNHLSAAGKSAATINQRLAPVRKLAEQTAAAGWFPIPTAGEVRAVKGVKQRGTRSGNWLTAEDAERLLAAPDRSLLAGKRDFALLSLFVGAGLRREELASLKQAAIQRRDGRWCIVDIEGKGKRVRTVAIPAWVKAAIDEWLAFVPVPMQFVLGKVNKGGRFVGEGMSAAAIYSIVHEYSERIGVPIAPHDLRRTYGKLAHQGGARIEQIQISYGHSSLTTTERYLGVDQDLVDAPCDHLRLQTPAVAAPPCPEPVSVLADPDDDARTRTARILLWMPIENKSKFVRGKSKARRRIEWFCLSHYQMKPGPRANEYLLQVPYRDEADLNNIVEDLLCEVAREADLYNCFTEPSAEDLESGRSW